MRKVFCEALLEYLPLSGNLFCPKRWPRRQGRRQVQSRVVLRVQTQSPRLRGPGENSCFKAETSLQVACQGHGRP